MIRALLLLAVPWAALWAGDASAAEGRRVALVVGNGGYEAVDPLPNARNDARLIASTLRLAGFELVGGGARLDLDKPRFQAAVEEFVRSARGADAALFYYSGHGMQAKGVNWLFPVNANPRQGSDVESELVDAGWVLRLMEQDGARLKLMILDACRDNPFPSQKMWQMQQGPVQKGLAQMAVPAGTLLSYATQPGNVASDGADGNSPFTAALSEAMMQRGLDVFQVFNRVGLAVARNTDGKQQPWLAVSPIAGSFAFLEGVTPVQAPVLAPVQAPGQAPGQAPVQPLGQGPAVDADTVFWQFIANSSDPSDFEAYLRQFPNGLFSELARRRVAALAAPLSRPEFSRVPPRASGPGAAAGDVVGGRWTTGSAAECGRRFYDWRSVGDRYEFQDQAGQVDTERVVSRFEGGASTETIATTRGAQSLGTRWDYRFVGPNTVRVQNVGNGRSFTLTRCP